MSAVSDRHLAQKGFGMALKHRCPGVGRLHHSDQGSTQASEDYQRLLDTYGTTSSMSRRGDYYDNVVMEAFSRRSRARWRTAFRAAAKPRWSCRHIDVFHNARRRHSTLGRDSFEPNTPQDSATALSTRVVENSDTSHLAQKCYHRVTETRKLMFPCERRSRLAASGREASWHRRDVLGR